jgi:hypothetical protein
MNRKTNLAAALGVLALAISAPGAVAKAPQEGAAARPERQCFRASQVYGFASADEKTVNLRVGVRDVYQFEMYGRCHDVDWAQRIAIVSRGSSWICRGLDAELITPSPIGPQRCHVKNMRKLTPEEVKALPRLGRP